jgi:hypothetical protein
MPIIPRIGAPSPAFARDRADTMVIGSTLAGVLNPADTVRD